MIHERCEIPEIIKLNSQLITVCLFCWNSRVPNSGNCYQIVFCCRLVDCESGNFLFDCFDADKGRMSHRMNHMKFSGCYLWNTYLLLFRGSHSQWTPSCDRRNEIFFNLSLMFTTFWFNSKLLLWGRTTKISIFIIQKKILSFDLSARQFSINPDEKWKSTFLLLLWTRFLFLWAKTTLPGFQSWRILNNRISFCGFPTSGSFEKQRKLKMRTRMKSFLVCCY